MKHLFLLTLITFTITAQPIILHTKTKDPQANPNPIVLAESDDTDGQVVLANIAKMLGCIGMLSTDPYNPAVAGPSLAQIGISFINIITQIFKSHGFDEEISRACVQNWFENLSDESKLELINLFMHHAADIRSHEYCPHCECEWCTGFRLTECRDCR